MNKKILISAIFLLSIASLSLIYFQGKAIAADEIILEENSEPTIIDVINSGGQFGVNTELTGNQTTIDSIINAIASAYGYQEEVEQLNEETKEYEIIPNPQSKDEFAQKHYYEHTLEVLKGYLKDQSRESSDSVYNAAIEVIEPNN